MTEDAKPSGPSLGKHTSAPIRMANSRAQLRIWGCLGDSNRHNPHLILALPHSVLCGQCPVCPYLPDITINSLSQRLWEDSVIFVNLSLFLLSPFPSHLWASQGALCSTSFFCLDCFYLNLRPPVGTPLRALDNWRLLSCWKTPFLIFRSLNLQIPA